MSSSSPPLSGSEHLLVDNTAPIDDIMPVVDQPSRKISHLFGTIDRANQLSSCADGQSEVGREIQYW